VDALMNGRLLDTTVLIDLSRGSFDAADYIDGEVKAETPLFVSIISAMEIVVGCRNKAEIDKVKLLIADFNLMHLSPDASAQAYELLLTYNKSHGLTIPDALIAATAITHQLELATDNERHFKMIPDLVVKRPY
jgi:predicted nucleic acid-binding protein